MSTNFILAVLSFYYYLVRGSFSVGFGRIYQFDIKNHFPLRSSVICLWRMIFAVFENCSVISETKNLYCPVFFFLLHRSYKHRIWRWRCFLLLCGRQNLSAKKSVKIYHWIHRFDDVRRCDKSLKKLCSWFWPQDVQQILWSRSNDKTQNPNHFVGGGRHRCKRLSQHLSEK